MSRTIKTQPVFYRQRLFQPQILPNLPVADSNDFFDFEAALADLSPIDIGEITINIDDINARQDQVLIELDQLDSKITEIIEIWTSTDASDTNTDDFEAAA